MHGPMNVEFDRCHSILLCNERAFLCSDGRRKQLIC